MNSGIEGMPGYKLNEYLLVLDPHEELRSRIMSIKKDFYEKYDAPMALGGRPHITLVRFTQLEMLEERIVNRIKTVAMGYQAFKVELKNFGSFPTHSIYINVITKVAVEGLVKQLKSAQRLMKLDNEHKAHFIEEPYILIARKLVPWQYEKSWMEYSSKHFTGRFIADGILLLKRPAGAKAYQILQRFEFMNLPVFTKQGDLFG